MLDDILGGVSKFIIDSYHCLVYWWARAGTILGLDLLINTNRLHYQQNFVECSFSILSFTLTFSTIIS